MNSDIGFSLTCPLPFETVDRDILTNSSLVNWLARLEIASKSGSLCLVFFKGGVGNLSPLLLVFSYHLGKIWISGTHKEEKKENDSSLLPLVVLFVTVDNPPNFRFEPDWTMEIGEGVSVFWLEAFDWEYSLDFNNLSSCPASLILDNSSGAINFFGLLREDRSICGCLFNTFEDSKIQASL